MESFKQYFESTDDLDNLVNSLRAQYPGLDLFVTQNPTHVYIHEIRLPKELRGKGIGTKVIQAIQQYAQSIQLPIVLTPEAEKRSKGKLLRFYKNLDFYHNYGRRKDYSLSRTFGPTWIWRPTKLSESFTYIGQCNHMHMCGKGKSWEQMIQQAIPVSKQEFLANVDVSPLLDEDETPQDYFSQYGDIGFFKSTWEGKPAYFFEHSGFEFIFVEKL